MAKKKGFRWGFEWGKVVSGGLMLRLGGGITLVGWFLGWISLWAVVLAVVGFLTMITGLMGKDGVWKHRSAAKVGLRPILPATTAAER